MHTWRYYVHKKPLILCLSDRYMAYNVASQEAGDIGTPIPIFSRHKKRIRNSREAAETQQRGGRGRKRDMERGLAGGLSSTRCIIGMEGLAARR